MTLNIMGIIQKNESQEVLKSLGFQTCGAVNGTRTRGPQLGKLMLYQLSYYRMMVGQGGVSATCWPAAHR